MYQSYYLLSHRYCSKLVHKNNRNAVIVSLKTYRASIGLCSTTGGS